MVNLYKVVVVLKKKESSKIYINNVKKKRLCLNNDEYNEYDSLKEKSKNRNISKLHPLHCEGHAASPLLTVFDC